jgi:hypothetical protein
MVVVTHSGRRFLHVASGTCTTDLITAAAIPGAVSIWADPLYEGPVPGEVTDAQLLEVRARYLSGETDTVDVDEVNDLRRWRSTIADHASYDELVLWFEHDLFDQLNLVQVLCWIHNRLPPAKTVSLICIGSFPGRPAFKGLGELTPHELSSLFDAREPVGDAVYRLAERAWAAFRASSPTALDRLRQEDTSARPFLESAIARFLQEYPSARDGLSRTERRLLELAGTGPIEIASAFPHMHEGEHAYYVTDLSFARLVNALSLPPAPLLALATRENGARAIPSGTMALTALGRDVLSGRQDRISACGIDRWLGGVHLRARLSEWRWEEALGAVVRR